MINFIRKYFKIIYNKKGEVHVNTIIKTIICVVVGALLLSSLYYVAGSAMDTATNKVNSLFALNNIDETMPNEDGNAEEGEVNKPYLTFKSENPFTIKTTIKWDGTIECSTDSINWSIWDGSLVSSINNKLYFRGNNNTRISATSVLSYASWIIDGLNVDCIGNIENLLDYKTVVLGEHPIMSNYCYAGMFRNCIALNSAPKLPATAITEYCYYRTFAGCTSLMAIPELPAITLSKNCYDQMFSGCTSLIAVDTLPATELQNYCYSKMFYNCTALTYAPTLPAVALNNYCYSGMFWGCTALKVAPELTSTSIVSGCYNQMFRGCTSLIAAPILPATAIGATYCYQEMFYCCTALTIAPALPATTISSFCYSSMFRDCTSLTTLPELPATKLKESCYEYMFYGCTALKMSTAQTGAYQYEWRVPATTAATNWNRHIFSNTGGTYTSNPSLNIVYYAENVPVK